MVKDQNCNFYYSQFGEDALIQTYFKNKAWNSSGTLQIPKKGFYIDIGSYNPISLSNTFWFYNHGWSGITIDPTPGVKEAFDTLRPKDINIQIAISNEEGILKFYSWGRAGINTLKIEEVTKSLLEDKNLKPPVEIDVVSLKLTSVLDKYLPLSQEIDFMSIDVEGNDLNVLQSNDWNKYRPEIVVVELLLDSIEVLIESEVYLFMKDKNYELIYWAQPSLIFKNCSDKLS